METQQQQGLGKPTLLGWHLEKNRSVLQGECLKTEVGFDIQPDPSRYLNSFIKNANESEA